MTVKTYNSPLVLSAVRKALRTRRANMIAVDLPLCPYDLAGEMGIDVRFSDALSGLDGLYLAGTKPIILVASQRPSGRQRFTCGHEIGHHVFCDGDSADTIVQVSSQSDFVCKEFRATAFAGFLLMPHKAIQSLCSIAGLDLETLRQEDVYRMACWFGVGYETIIVQLQAYGFITASLAKHLRSRQPRYIRRALTTSSFDADVIAVDTWWNGRAIDVTIGDAIQAPFPLHFDGNHMVVATGLHGSTAISPLDTGVFRISNDELAWAAYVRVMQHHFTGRAVYRHLAEEPGYE